MNWHPHLRHHPAVRPVDQLPRGERAAQYVADLLGSWRFIIIQTLIIIVWIGYNVWAAAQVLDGVFDPYPFILLNLAFSTQAAYAAPLLQLASNRQITMQAELLADTHRLLSCMHASPATGSCSCAPGVHS